MADEIRVYATVRGRVQMVGFRAFVLDRAWDLEVRGTVANRPDGSVECIVEGPRDQVESLLQALREGPTSARVDAVEVVEQPVRGDLPAMRVTA
jgi:acylphosphatase